MQPNGQNEIFWKIKGLEHFLCLQVLTKQLCKKPPVLSISGQNSQFWIVFAKMGETRFFQISKFSKSEERGIIMVFIRAKCKFLLPKTVFFFNFEKNSRLIGSLDFHTFFSQRNRKPQILVFWPNLGHIWPKRAIFEISPKMLTSFFSNYREYASNKKLGNSDARFSKKNVKNIHFWSF